MNLILTVTEVPARNTPKGLGRGHTEAVMVIWGEGA